MSENEKYHRLAKWVNTLRNGEALNLKLDSIKQFLYDDLKIAHQLHPLLEQVLPPMLVVYIHKWKSWDLINDKSVAETLVAKELFVYLKTQIEELVNDKFQETLNENDRKRLKPETSFRLKITCPPRDVNSLLFVSEEDDVKMLFHDTLPWGDLTTPQLANWPCIELEFHSPELSFSRKMDINYYRTLTRGFTKNVAPYPSHDPTASLVESVENKNCSVKRCAYTCKLLAAYAQEMIDVFRVTAQFSQEEFEELEGLLQTFIGDIKIAHFLDCIATNTAIRVVMSRKAKYIRLKKEPKEGSEKKPHEKVNFSEVIVPKLEFCLNHFEGVQVKGTESFIEGKAEGFPLPKIAYRCSYCDISLGARSKAIEHLKAKHKVEKNIWCKGCHKAFSILKLTEDRWDHDCH